MAKLPWGQNMIKVDIKFFTDNLSKSPKVDEKTAWTRGVISLPKNASRHIKPAQINFNSKEELLPKMQKLLKENNIKLVRLPTSAVEFEELI